MPATKPNPGQTDRLEIIAADLTHALGRPLDGDDDGQLGSNFAATFGNQGISFAQPSIRLEGAERPPDPSDRRALQTAAIDALFDRKELADVKEAIHT